MKKIACSILLTAVMTSCASPPAEPTPTAQSHLEDVSIPQPVAELTSENATETIAFKIPEKPEQNCKEQREEIVDYIQKHLAKNKIRLEYRLDLQNYTGGGLANNCKFTLINAGTEYKFSIQTKEIKSNFKKSKVDQELDILIKSAQQEPGYIWHSVSLKGTTAALKKDKILTILSLVQK